MDTLRTNKLRSGLTMLGIMIGVTTVILISSVITGLTGNVNGLIKSLGANVYWVYRFPVFGSRPTAEMLARKQMSYEDGEAMKGLPGVVAVSTHRSNIARLKEGWVVSRSNTEATRYKTPSCRASRRANLMSATFLSPRDASSQHKRRSAGPTWSFWALTPPRNSLATILLLARRCRSAVTCSQWWASLRPRSRLRRGQESGG